MKTKWIVLNFLVILAMLLAACGQQHPGSKDVLYVNLVWHQHQPLYYKDDAGVYTRPWVRVHATKDYYDMAAILQEYPDVHVTFNLTPVLIRQLDDYADNGAKDLYWQLAEKPASDLTDDEKRFILQRFFDANWDHIIAVYPRYQELLDLRGGTDTAAIESALATFTEQDYRDLQIWFNLAWFDPDLLAADPLKSLVEKGRNFTEADKQILFAEALRIIQAVIPLHKEMQSDGQIEVITTPFAHPILPLLVDTNLAREGNPGVETPPQFSYPQDALTHLERSVAIYEENFGQPPQGLWPGEGAVAQTIVPFVIKSGYTWMATGEPVLAKSLNLDGFTRDAAETVQQADDLYRPYYVTDANGNQLAVFFRDGVISDKVGFTYSGISGEAAAEDLIQRLENIRTELKDEGAEGPHIVSIILDGENAWENYDNDGKEFFHSLYSLLSESKTLQTVTPSQYLEWFPEQRSLDNLFAAAWFSPNYDTWLGEAEENMAWDYLRQTRAVLAKYDISKVRTASPEAIAQAQDFMYLAEGSDWFWWYGADQDSGQDDYFDTGFRALLKGVFDSLGEPVPNFVNVPIIQPRPVQAAQPVQGMSTPVIDGKIDGDEWSLGAAYPAEVQTPFASGLGYTYDANNLYLRLDLTRPMSASDQVGFYFVAPRAAGSNPFVNISADEPLLLGVAATHLVEVTAKGSLSAYTGGETGWTKIEALGEASVSDSVIEVAIPFKLFGEMETGDDIRLLTVAQPDNQFIPTGGPAQIIVPEIGNATVVFEVEDPEGDDNGPGTYTYPTDAIFVGKMFDLKSFRVAYDENNIIFKFSFYGAIPNPWGSPNNLAVQTLDVYIDKDPGGGTGARLLLPGRNAALEAGSGWDYAVWAEGWTPQILAPNPETLEPIQITEAQFKIIADAGARTVTLRVPKDVFGEGDPATWGYTAVVLGQEGYPASGVWRVRDVEAAVAQWRFGGAPADTNHTRIIDMIWPSESDITQAEMLSNYPPSTTSAGELTADDFAQIRLLLAK